MRIAKILFALTLLFGVAATEAGAVQKKTSPSTGSPTAAQREKMYADGLIACRKKYRTELHSVRVEKFYGRWGAVCYHY